MAREFRAHPETLPYVLELLALVKPRMRGLVCWRPMPGSVPAEVSFRGVPLREDESVPVGVLRFDFGPECAPEDLTLTRDWTEWRAIKTEGPRLLRPPEPI